MDTWRYKRIKKWHNNPDSDPKYIEHVTKMHCSGKN